MKNHNKRTEPDTRRGVTLSDVLSLLKPYDQVFIERSIGPHELEAVGGRTEEELRAIRCVETCGDCKVERLGLTIDEQTEDWIGQDMPVVSIYFAKWLLSNTGRTARRPAISGTDRGRRYAAFRRHNGHIRL